MGNKLAVSANQPLEQYLYEQPSLTYDGTIGKGRFLKTIKCLHPEGPVVVKIFVKEDKSDSLSRQIERARVALTGIVLLLLLLLLRSSVPSAVCSIVIRFDSFSPVCV